MHNKSLWQSITFNPNVNSESGDLDEKETMKNSKFPLDPEKLMVLTKQLLSPEAEFGSKNPDLLAEDFKFIFPIWFMKTN